MEKRVHTIETVSDYCRFFGVQVQHPSVTIADFQDYGAYPAGLMQANLYCIMYKELDCGEMKYGRSRYDYQAGTLLFISPGQVIGLNGRTPGSPKSRGKVLLIHPDLMYGTPLARLIGGYSFFSYDSNEALHMSDREKEIVLGCLAEIKAELELCIDRHTRKIVCSRIETLLDHCERFYERQFVTREVANHSVISKLDTYLRDYFDSDRPADSGIPTVQSCASEMCLSANYFSDLVKRETGKTAHEYIQGHVIGLAKILLSEKDKNITAIAYELGFRYPHHLTRVFKKQTGLTPQEYRTIAN